MLTVNILAVDIANMSQDVVAESEFFSTCVVYYVLDTVNDVCLNVSFMYF
jgi:hypothetical protein